MSSCKVAGECVITGSLERKTSSNLCVVSLCLDGVNTPITVFSHQCKVPAFMNVYHGALSSRHRPSAAQRLDVRSQRLVQGHPANSLPFTFLLLSAPNVSLQKSYSFSFAPSLTGVFTFCSVLSSTHFMGFSKAVSNKSVTSRLQRK